MSHGEHAGQQGQERTGEGHPDPSLESLRARLDELQRNVERVGRKEQAEGRVGEPPTSPAADDRALRPEALALALGPIGRLLEVQALEDEIAGVPSITDVRVRWVGRGWARLDVTTTDPAGLPHALVGLGRPLELEPRADGLIVVRFTDSDTPAKPLPDEAPPPPSSGATASAEQVAARRLPETVCRHFRMVPVRFDDATLTLAIVDPSDPLALDVAAALSGAPVSAVSASDEQIEAAIEAAFGGARGTAATLDETQRAADELGMPMIDPAGMEPTDEALDALPDELRREIPCAPLDADDAVVYLAVSAPPDLEAVERIDAETGGRRLRLLLARPDDLSALPMAARSEPGTALRSPPPTAFPGKRARRRRAAAIPLAIWAFLRAPLPIGVALVSVAALVYLYLAT